MIGYVYLIKNTYNTKLYVGQTTHNIELRFRAHKSKARNTPLLLINKEMARIGIESFYYKQLAMFSSEDENELKNILSDSEKFYIFLYDTDNPEKGYNSKRPSIYNETKPIIKRNYYLSKETKQINQNAPNNKSVNQYNIDGTFIKTYNSLTEAALEMSNTITNISSACNGRVKTSGGFVWRYTITDDKGDISPFENKNNLNKNNLVIKEMAISKLLNEMVEKINQGGSTKYLDTELKQIEKNNYKTYITTLYSIIKIIDPKYKDIYKPTKEQIEKLKELPTAIKYDEAIEGKMLEEIIENRYKGDWRAILTYQLLNTGRRQTELLLNAYEIKDNHLYIVIDKQADKTLQKVEMVLDGDLVGVDKDLKEIRKQTEHNSNASCTSMLYRYVHHKYKINPHMLRAIYVRYIYLFHNPQKESIGSMVRLYTNHKGHSSDTSYANIFLDLEHELFTKPVVEKIEIKTKTEKPKKEKVKKEKVKKEKVKKEKKEGGNIVNIPQSLNKELLEQLVEILSKLK